jgi:hypothetical protein
MSRFAHQVPSKEPYMTQESRLTDIAPIPRYQANIVEVAAGDERRQDLWQ